MAVWGTTEGISIVPRSSRNDGISRYSPATASRYHANPWQEIRPRSVCPIADAELPSAQVLATISCCFLNACPDFVQHLYQTVLVKSRSHYSRGWRGLISGVSVSAEFPVMPGWKDCKTVGKFLYSLGNDPKNVALVASGITVENGLKNAGLMYVNT